MHTVYIALGTNLGDRPANLLAALAAMPPDVQVQERSAIYETPPWGVLDQPDFLNQVVKADTRLGPEDLLAYLKRIEVQLGRQAAVRFGPRLIDLDILFYDDLILEMDMLTIPHPRLRGRAFVLLPLAEIAPDLLHPGLELTAAQMLSEVDTDGIRRYQEVSI